MSRWQGLHVEAEGTGISKPLSEQVNLLGALLGRVIKEQAGDDMLDLVEALRQRCKRALQEDQPALLNEVEATIQRLSLDEIVWLLRSYTAFFHLVNQAEQQEIIRINRERAQHSKPEAPRAESIAAAIFRLKRQGYTLDQVVRLLEQLDIQPTLTAHPTEARRRSILFKQQHIAALLTQLRRCDPTPAEREQSLNEIHNQISLLLATDEVRTERLTVEAEVEHGLYFVRNTIWETVPQIYQDTRLALQQYYGEAPDFSPFLRYRSWIGSDRDGNPNVTPAVTRWTFDMQRQIALQLYEAELHQLRRDLSLSDRQVTIPPQLVASIEHDATELTLPGNVLRQFKHEPYRLKVSYILARLEQMRRQLEAASSSLSTSYGSAQFMEDLRLVKTCLEAGGLGEIVYSGRLGRLLVQAETFGFHLAALDVRQHSSVHERAVTELLKLAGVRDNYAQLSEEERLRCLTAELQNPRPLQPRGAALPETARNVLATFDTIRYLLDQEPASVSSYIISMTHEVSDLLEVMLLAKEAGLWQMENGKVASPLDLVPLFETIDDLHRADDFMEALFSHAIYRKHVAARNDFQEIMLGYSDSNKDGGYWMANWALHKAQERLGRVCRTHNMDFRLFHGRGGTIGRGGGRANQAILAMPSVVHNGRIRFTEQGEVISFRYALSDIAQRHLEQIVNAMVQAVSHPAAVEEEATTETDVHLMDEVAEHAMAAYLNLITDEDLWTWYTRITPIEQISRLPIASRPVSRKSAQEVDFESLRAIPWVFAWTQTRYIVPGWFGVGQALQQTLTDHPEQVETLRRLYREWHFFRAVVNNAQREMARARLDIARRYAGLAAEDEHALFYHERIVQDFERARRAILQITQQNALLDNNPVIQKSISLRNPYTDVLNLLQIELINRYRRAPEQEHDALRHALFLSINGIAAAMQSTG